MPLPHRRASSGQASLDYLGVLCVVAVTLAAGGGAVAPPDLAGTVGRTLRTALCRVAGGVCTTAEAQAAGLRACLVHVRSDDERLRVNLGVVRLGRDDALVVERRSDGTAGVSFVDGWHGGAETAIGVSFTPVRLTGRAAIGVGVRYASGAAWEFGDHAAADRFVTRFAPGEALRGEATGELPFGSDGPRPAAPNATYTEGGPFAEGALDARIPLGGRGARLEAGASTSGVLGRRERGPETTWYVRVADDVLARLGIVFGAVGAELAREGVLEYTTRDGRPVRATVRSAGGLAADVGVFGVRTDLGTLARRLRAAGAGGTAGGREGLQLDAAVSLDLREAENLAAVRDVLRLQDPLAAVRAVRRLGDRLDAAGDVDLAVYRTSSRRQEAGAQVGAGVAAGVAYEHTVRSRDLLRAWAVTRGGPLREREDCSGG